MAMRFGAVGLSILILGLSSGCARSVQIPARPIPQMLGEDSPFLLPGLATGDAWLRHYLIQEDPAAALEIFQSPSDRPTSDPLLLSLYQAVIHRQAGDFAESNDLLEWADQEAERRHVRSVSRTAASFLISDRALSYTPTATERAMIPYYRTMNYLDSGDTEAAAVEARRISALLSETEASDLRRCRGDAMLNHLAGLVFERAGEWNDAIVSLRRAEADYGACADAGLIAPDVELTTDLIRVASAAGLNELADSLTALHPGAVHPLGSDSAEVIVFVESGFIAYRAEEALHVPLYGDDLEGLESDDDDRIAEVAANAIARLARNAGDRARWGGSWDDDPGVQVGQALEGAHILRLAWPAIRLPETGASLPGARLWIGGLEASASPVGNLSALAVAELEAERPAMLTRLVVRSLTKYLVSREVEKKAEKQGGELLGFVAARLMNFAANETERADTRSWTLLPAEIQIVRRRVAAGEVAVGRFEQLPIAAGRVEREMAGPAVRMVASVVPAKAGTQLFNGTNHADQQIAHSESVAGDLEAQDPASTMSRQLRVGAGERRIVSISVFGDQAATTDELPIEVEADFLAEDSPASVERTDPSAEGATGSDLE